MTPQDREQIGEYVLGLLEDSQAQAFEARLANEPELATAVAKLQAQLETLDDTAGELPAGPALWQRIADRLDGPNAEQAQPALNRSANDNHWTRRLGMAASIVIALAVGYLTGTHLTTSRQPVMIAVLLSEDGSEPGAIVEAYADDTIRLVPFDLTARPADRVYQVWTLPDPETGPVSMGIFDDPATLSLSGPDLPPPEPGQLYEITLEPSGGSPTGRPTGPILVKGFAKMPL
ncbi:anti-sigma factor [uncultured Devosia sp.]|uniref:anti-sigma factor n=1 Tax=uncultured Devosia sp. TaxID=211434 RepID=UPI0026122663|nr:anti-sigma factor [uncultured Devosia sp.]